MSGTTRVPLVGVTRCQNCGALISTSGDTHRCATLTTRVEPACHSADVETGTGSPVAAGGSPALSQTTDPLDAYSSRDRLLRECIENVIFRATVGGDMPPQWRGTLHLANEIMAHVKAAYNA